MIKSAKGRSINCFGLFSKSNDFLYKNTEKNITADFVVEMLETLSFSIKNFTVVVLDNAPVHCARKIKERLQIWQQRGLFIFYLPPYSPHLNLIERLWKEFKQRWLKVEDYQSRDSLFYAVNRICANVGTNLFLHTSMKFSYT